MDNSKLAVSKYLTQIEDEIRVPITSIIGSVERISRENADAGMHDDIVSIRKASDRLIMLTDDIVDIVRISNDELEISEEDYDFEDVLLEIRHLIEKQTALKGIENEIDIDTNLPCRFFGDKKRITKMLRRLIRRAVEATQYGKVKFQAGCIPGALGNMFVRFDVSDSGSGELDEDVAATLAGKTAIGDVSETATSIFIIKYIAGKMGGKFTARAKRGEGCTFTLLISQKPVGIATFKDRMQESDDIGTRDQSFMLEKGRALVVGEDREVALLGQQAIYKYHIGSDITDDADQACRMLNRIKYDFVVASENMKLDNGSYLIDEIRKLDNEAPDEEGSAVTLPVIGIEPVYGEGGADPSKFSAHTSIPFQKDELEKILLEIFPSAKVRFTADHSYAGIGIESLESLGLNSSEAFAKFGSDEAGYKKAVLSVCRSSDTKGKMLNYYLDQSDYKNYIVVVHSMLEATQLIGSEKLSEKARELEKAAKYNPTPELAEETAAFAVEYEKMLAAVRSVMTDASDDVNKGAIDREDLIYLINELRGYLSAYQINEVEELFFTLAQFSYKDPRVMEFIHEAEEHMLCYNYNEVMASLDKIVALLEV